MKKTGKILLVILFILALPFLVALFVNNDYAVEREITINKARPVVFKFVKHLKNQDSYNKWVRMDPEMKKDYKGTDGTKGFVYSWDGEEAGKGEQEIRNLIEGERIDLELRFIKPFESTASAHLITEALSADQTRVKWGMKGRSPYPMNFMNLFMDSMLGKDLETSLSDLKNILEKNELTVK